MVIKQFKDLSENDRRKIYDFILSFGQHNYFSNFEEMVKMFGGVIYDNGSSHFSLWDGERIAASGGVVTKEAVVRGEVFAHVNAKQEESGNADIVVKSIIDYCTNFEYDSMKLGVRTNMSYLASTVEANGFKESYRLHILRLDKESTLLENIRLEGSRFENLQEKNKLQFQTVHNEAFLISPNGAAFEDGEVDELMEDNKSHPQLNGLYYHDGKPAGMYMLSIKDNVGWIDALAVCPELHGRGIGKILLKRAIKLLNEAGAPVIKLSVMSSNAHAHSLYLRCGFVEESVESVWFERIK